MKYKFYGGPKHGKLLDVPDSWRDQVKVAVFEPMDFGALPEILPEQIYSPKVASYSKAEVQFVGKFVEMAYIFTGYD